MDEIKADSRSSCYLIILFTLFNTFYKLLVLGASEWYGRLDHVFSAFILVYFQGAFIAGQSNSVCLRYIGVSILHWTCVLRQIITLRKWGYLLRFCNLYYNQMKLKDVCLDGCENSSIVYFSINPYLVICRVYFKCIDVPIACCNDMWSNY